MELTISITVDSQLAVIRTEPVTLSADVAPDAEEPELELGVRFESSGAIVGHSIPEVLRKLAETIESGAATTELGAVPADVAAMVEADGYR